jgi:hypothetical protein
VEDVMRFSTLILTAVVGLVCCGEANAARTNWIGSPGLPCETVCRHPVTVGGRPDAFVCAGHVKGAPANEIRSGMIGAGSPHCYVPGEVGRVKTDGPFVCLCAPR